MFWLINVYYILLYTQIQNFDALFYLAGMHPYFKAMHSHLSFNCSSLYHTFYILDSDDSFGSSRSVWPVILFRVSLGILQVSMT